MADPRPSRLLPIGDGDGFKFLRRLPWEKMAIWALFFVLLWVLRRFFTVIFLTFILSYIAYGVASRICRKLGIAEPSGRVWYLTTFGVFLALLGVMIGLGVYVLPEVTAQGQAFAEEFQLGAVAPEAKGGGAGAVAPPHAGEPATEPRRDSIRREQVIQALRKLLPLSMSKPLEDAGSPYHRTSQRVADALTAWINEELPSLTRWLGKSLLGFLTFLFNFLFAYIFALLIVLDLPRISAKVQSLAESNVKGFYDEIAPGIFAFGNGMGRAFQAQTIIALVNTALTALGLLALGIPAIAVLSVIVFFCSFIPVAGVFLSTVPIALMALNHGSGSTMLAAIVLVVIIHLIEAYILNPRIMGQVMHMHPLIVLVILFVGEHLFGVWGLLLGVPTCQWVFTYWIEKRKERAGETGKFPAAPVGSSGE